MIGVIPPTGVPIKLRVLLRPRNDFDCDSFNGLLQKRIGGEVFLTNSGKAAIYLILKAIRRIYPERNEVIVPAYTCWSVPSAVVRAGLRVRTIDIEKENLSISPKLLEGNINNKTLAVITTHLFGISGEIEEVEKICREKKIILVDDAAQALGASINGKLLGSFGDAGVLSFGRGKNITTISGGAAIIRNKGIAKEAFTIYKREFPKVKPSNFKDNLRLTAYKFLSNRCLYWLPDKMPFLKIGETFFNPNFILSRLPFNRCGIGIRMLNRLEEITSKRRAKADIYRDELDKLNGVAILSPPPNLKPAYLRFPLILTANKNRRYILKKGHRLGISGMYPGTINSIGDRQDYFIDDTIPCPSAKIVAESLITLPTHHLIRKADIEKIVSFIKRTI